MSDCRFVVSPVIYPDPELSFRRAVALASYIDIVHRYSTFDITFSGPLGPRSSKLLFGISFAHLGGRTRHKGCRIRQYLS